MRTPNLNEMTISETLTCIDINDLIKAGLILSESGEIPKEFHYVQQVNESKLFFVHINRSGGWSGNLEIHYGFFLEPSDNCENVHLEQEISLYQNENGNLYFICPLLGEENYCTTLYLRHDFPIFGSKKALNIK